jgi:hypothetical protein
LQVQVGEIKSLLKTLVKGKQKEKDPKDLIIDWSPVNAQKLRSAGSSKASSSKVASQASTSKSVKTTTQTTIGRTRHLSERSERKRPKRDHSRSSRSERSSSSSSSSSARPPAAIFYDDIDKDVRNALRVTNFFLFSLFSFVMLFQCFYLICMYFMNSLKQSGLWIDSRRIKGWT